MLVLAWAVAVSLSGGARAQTGTAASQTVKKNAPRATAVELPPPRTTHFSRRETAPELRVSAWVDQTGPATAPQLQGKVQLVVFWGVNCPACVKKIPKVRAVAQQYQDSELVVIGLHNAYITPAQVTKFARSRGLNYPIAIDRTANKRSSWGMTTDAYRVRAIPHAAVVDRDGSLKYVGKFETALQQAEALLKLTSG